MLEHQHVTSLGVAHCKFGLKLPFHMFPMLCNTLCSPSQRSRLYMYTIKKPYWFISGIHECRHILYIRISLINESIIHFLLTAQCCSQKGTVTQHASNSTYTCCTFASSCIGNCICENNRILGQSWDSGSGITDERVVSTGQWHSLYLLCFYFHWNNFKAGCVLYFCHKQRDTSVFLMLTFHHSAQVISLFLFSR